MTWPTCRLAVLGALVLALAGPSRAGSLSDALELSIEVVRNPVEGGPQSGCQRTARAEGPRQRWWVTFGRARPSFDENWQVIDDRIGCGVGRWQEDSGDSPPGSPYLVVEFSSSAGLLPANLTPERVLVLDLSLSLRKLSGFAAAEQPLYEEIPDKRKFYFLDKGEALLPLLVAGKAEEEAIGTRELWLRMVAGEVGGQTAQTYGTIRLIAGGDAAELFLDGGSLGTPSEGSQTVLRNVPTGLRLVGVREASGRRIHKPVRVESRRTSIVDLSAPGHVGNSARFRLEALGENAQAYREYRRVSDGAIVVEIPAGEFLMGNEATEGSPLEHEVYVSSFLIDKLGVTWGQYMKYAAASGTPLPPRDPYWGVNENHPMVFVTWEEAKAYCEWAGGRLPTEAEREKASRGTDGRKYPWGDREPAPDLAVFRSSWGLEATAAVGSRPAGASPYGVLDLGGNVWEWCSDWHDRHYFEVSPYRDPKGPDSGTAHVLKGGSWDSRPSVLSCSSRNFGFRGYRELDFGFRCAMNTPMGEPRR